jgi:hypothetical protein
MDIGCGCSHKRRRIYGSFQGLVDDDDVDVYILKFLILILMLNDDVDVDVSSSFQPLADIMASDPHFARRFW